MKINVGDYVRNKYGIAKIINIENNNGIDALTFDKNICFMANDKTGKIRDDKLFNYLPITKEIDINKINSSPDIRGLIEEGDFVTYKIGDFYFNIPTRVCGLFDELTLSIVKMVGDNFLNEIEITSIVTKEQFERMKYEVK